MRITAKEVNNSKNKLVFDWLPSEIKDDGGNIIFANYNLLDRGEVVRPAGRDLRKISWSSSFPGESRKDLTILAGPWRDPMECDDLLNRWRSKGKLISLTIEGTNISGFKCYVHQYASAYAGGLGDLEYSITWVAYAPISVKVRKATKKNGKPTRPAKSFTSYTIKKGDTLWGIADKYLGKGTRWPEIFKLNKSVIEAAAKKHHYGSSDNGNRIWPGTKLKLPKK